MDEQTKLTKNFKLSEFTNSDTANRLGISNKPDSQALENIKKTAEALQVIRDAFGKPLVISSGYRCPALNKAVGGSPTSSHVYGFAVDFKPEDMKDMRLLQVIALEALREKDVPFDQYIIEKPINGVAQWLHLGIGPKVRMQTLTIK